jgi:hypothetical protein
LPLASRKALGLGQIGALVDDAGFIMVFPSMSNAVNAAYWLDVYGINTLRYTGKPYAPEKVFFIKQ